MAHLDDAPIMNYILGREAGLVVRQHLHSCKSCQKRMQKLEDALVESAKEREAESFNFKVQVAVPKTP